MISISWLLSVLVAGQRTKQILHHLLQAKPLTTAAFWMGHADVFGRRFEEHLASMPCRDCRWATLMLACHSLRVLCDCLLVGDGNRLLFEGMGIGDSIRHRHQEMESRIEDFVKSPQALDHPGDLLGHHHDAYVQPWGRDAVTRLFRADCAVPGQRTPYLPFISLLLVSCHYINYCIKLTTLFAAGLQARRVATLNRRNPRCTSRIPSFG